MTHRVNANDAAWMTKPQLADFLGKVQLSKRVFSRVIQASESLRYEPASVKQLFVAANFPAERKSIVDKLLARIHLIVEMICWTGLALREFEFPSPGSLKSTFILHLSLLGQGLWGNNPV